MGSLDRHSQLQKAAVGFDWFILVGSVAGLLAGVFMKSSGAGIKRFWGTSLAP